MSKLPKKVTVWYGAAMFGKTLLTIMNTAYLSFFYTQVLGINIGIASSIILLAKIWDIVNDPIMGGLIDYTKSKEGKCRAWLKWFTVPAGITFALTFFCPELSGTGTVVWAVVIYLLQATLTTAINIPASTLMGRITQDKAERAALQQSNTIFTLIANLLASSVTMSLVVGIGGENQKVGFLAVSVIYAILYMIAFFITFRVTKGYEPTDVKAVEKAEEETIPLGRKIWLLLSNKVYLVLMIATFMLYLVQSVANGMTAYYVQYNMQNDLSFYYITSITGLVGAFIPAICLKLMIKKLGINGTAISGCVVGFIGLAIRFVLKDSGIFVISAGSFLFNMGMSLTAATTLLNVFDAGVYGVWKNPDAVQNEAMLLSVESSCYKIGMAVGGPIMGYVLMGVNFVEGAELQNAGVLQMLFDSQTLIPAVMLIIPALLYFWLRKIEKKIPQMQAEIDARSQHN